LAERAAAIDQVLTEREGFRVVVGHISRELGIPVDTLREQRAKTGLSWGELLVAQRISREGKVGLDDVVAEVRGGKSWEEAARAHKIDLAQLTSLIQRSQTTVERRSEDKPPPPISGAPSVVPGGARVPGLPSFGSKQ
jgi:hypothetical protein